MNVELAKRAVACKHWRWMPGMRVVRDNAWSEPLSQRVPCTVPNGGYPDAWPDLDDPATLGCLLALVREAQGDCTIWTMGDVDCDESAWICTGLEVGEIGSGYSEAHALVAALEAAP
jgi:hypothetical protein